MPSERQRSLPIDLLRGVAIALVLILHYQLAYRFDGKGLGWLLWNGNYGVTIFFVVSGFLITSNALRRYPRLQDMPWREFYVSRFARIMPPLLLMLAVVVALAFSPLDIFQQNEKNTSLGMAVFSVLTFWHNVLMASAGYFNYCLNVLWSLSVEEVFYLAFPMLWLILRRERLVQVVWIVLIVVGPLYRRAHATDEIAAFYAYFSCFDAIAVGCLTAFLARSVSLGKASSIVLLIVGCAVLVGTFTAGAIMDNVVFGFSLVALGTAACILATKDHGNRWLERLRVLHPLCWFGRHSYELYLFHVVVLGLMRSLYPRSELPHEYKIAWLGAFLAISTLIAWVVARFYAEPLNRRIRAHFA